MKTLLHPERSTWKQLLQRPAVDQTVLLDTVKRMLEDVKKNGDEAVKKYTLQFDGVATDPIQVSAEEIEKAGDFLSPSLRKAMETAAGNIRRFHAQQLQQPSIIETMPGIKCWRKSSAIEKVGLYIPGGTAPLFSTVLMLGIPAMLAGCKEIVLTSPPSFPAEGKETAIIHPAILYAAQLVGITKIFKAGGVQAIGALAYGTESIGAVYKIFGPGNQYVNCAKQLVQMDGVAIDMPAGPSEVCVIADESCDPAFVAADLLSQAEHGADSQVLLVCTDEKMMTKIIEETRRQMQDLPRRAMIEQALQNSHALLMPSIDEAVDLVNEYAPEHLIIACKDAERIGDAIINAGSVFLGDYSPESAGDYASGTNHVLPTNGSAKSYSGVSVDSFVKKITYQQITRSGLQQIGAAVEEMAAAEGLQAHKNAISIRIKNQ